MRMMLKATIPVEKGSQTIADGSLPRIIQEVLGELKPEAAYFLSLNGKRTALIFFEMADTSQIPTVAEPFFMAFDADVELVPVMNGDDLAKGLDGAAAAAKKYM
jgi:hypothetical protein